MSKCKCGKEITWGINEEGKFIPLDMKPPIYQILNSSDPIEKDKVSVIRAPKTFGVTHFATCSFANDFSKSKKKAD